jgi:hypothetical protein
MTVFSVSIPNLVNGVSQQPQALRLASQAELQENAYSSVVEGLRKRPPTKHIATVSGLPAGELFHHLINRDEIERYNVFIGNGDLKVFDLDGVAKTVAFPDGKAYLASTAPVKDIRAFTVSDYSFIVNRNIAVSTLTTKTPGKAQEALIRISQYTEGMTVRIKINNSTVAKYRAQIGGDSSFREYFDTSRVATAIAFGVTGYGGNEDVVSLDSSGINSANGWTVATYGNVVYIKKNDGADFSIVVDDSEGNNIAKLIKGVAQNFTELPSRARPGMVVKITGDVEDESSDYWVKYVDDPTTPEGAVWVECPAPDEEYKLDPSTMPHILVRESDGTFTFKQAVWADRPVGNLESCPFPSFVGRKINDVFFHRNRLGLLAAENLIMSEDGGTFNFYRATMTQVLDTDPIDVSASYSSSSSAVSNLLRAKSYNKSLLLFAGRSQFQLGSTDLLTPKTAAIYKTTDYDFSNTASPEGVGRNVYFPSSNGPYGTVREYYVDGETEAEDAADVTSHVPRYLPGDIRKLATCPNDNSLVALTTGATDRLYVYNYYWDGDTKLQSAWSAWVLDGEVVGCSFIENILHLVVRRGTEVSFENIAFGPSVFDGVQPYGVHLDRRVTETACTVSYDAGTNKTTITPPYAITEGDAGYRLVAWEGDARKPGQRVQYVMSGGNLVADGNLTKFFLGRTYTMRYRFSELRIKQADGGGQKAIDGDRLQIKSLVLLYANTGYFRVEVTPARRDTYTTTFSGRVVGSLANLIGEASVDSGKFSVGVLSKNDQVMIDIVNDSFLPCCFIGAEWTGLMLQRARRIG